VTSTQRQARAAGSLYLLMALTAPIGLLYVPARLLVPASATATADNIRSAEWLLRAGIASELVHQIIAVFLVLALYRLFRGVDESRARQLVILGALVSVPIMFVNVLNEVAALMLARGPAFLAVFEQAQRDALAYLFLHLHGQGITVTSVFWGLWLFPFGMLVIRSGFIPRVFGVLLIIAGVAYLAGSTSALVFPRYEPLVSRVVSPLTFAELPIILWLVIRGAKPRPADAPAV
jgi:hypothetical protein